MVVAIQEGPPGDTKLSIAVIHLIHGRQDRSALFLFSKERQLMDVFNQPRDGYPHQPHGLFEGEAVKNFQGRLEYLMAVV